MKTNNNTDKFDGTLIITREGYEKLKAEIKVLQEEIKQIIEAIKVSVAFGDRSENSEYLSAKQKKNIKESRLMHLNNALKRCEVIDSNLIANKDIVQFGATVTLECVNTKKKKKIKLVSTFESNAEKGFIDIRAPVGAMLVGKSVGDTVSYLKNKYVITNISYK